jgi:hypothetical protein
MRHEYASHSFEQNQGTTLTPRHMIVIMSGGTNSMRRRRQKNKPAKCGPV